MAAHRRILSSALASPAVLMATTLALFSALLSGCRTSQPITYQTAALAPTPPAAYPDPQTGEVGSASGTLSLTPVSPESPTASPLAYPDLATPTAGAPHITAKAAILVDSYGRVLFEKNADARLPIASTQKLLVGLLVAERGNLSAPVTIAEADTWAEPTILGIKPGEVYSRDALLHAVLVRSCNDVARALGRDHSGSEAAFVAQLNAKARELGMHNSYFTNSNGLPSPPGQYSTARDLSKLGLASLRNPVVRQICGLRSYTFRMANGSTKTLTNTNQVLRYFPQCIGLKTGYTNAAGRCLVSAATHNGRTVVAVILGSSSPTVWQESEALLRYGLGL